MEYDHPGYLCIYICIYICIYLSIYIWGSITCYNQPTGDLEIAQV